MGWEPPTLMLVRGVFSANPGPAIRGDRRCQAPRRARASGSTRIRRGPLLRDRDPLGFRHSDRDGAVGPERSVPTGPLVDGPPPSTGATQLWCSVACLWSCVPCFTENCVVNDSVGDFYLGDSQRDLGRTHVGLPSIRWQWEFNPWRCDECESQRGDGLWSTHSPGVCTILRRTSSGV